MKIFTCNDHKGWWPVPTASVIVAENEEQAFKMLKEKLKDYDIEDDEFTLKEIKTDTPDVHVLSHGDY